MTSKFQNRLVGTIILFTLGIMILPSLLDRKKKHYQNEFATIPLFQKPGDSDELETRLSVSQKLLNQQSEKTSKMIEQSTHSVGDRQTSKATKLEVKPTIQLENKSVKKLQKPKASIPRSQILKSEKTSDTEQSIKKQTWVVQLGALKNADKVLEIVAKLRLSGYCVYTFPSVPVQGQITRIFVGPNNSRDELQNVLSKLNQLSGLNGKLRHYNLL